MTGRILLCGQCVRDYYVGHQTYWLGALFINGVQMIFSYISPHFQSNIWTLAWPAWGISIMQDDWEATEGPAATRGPPRQPVWKIKVIDGWWRFKTIQPFLLRDQQLWFFCKGGKWQSRFTQELYTNITLRYLH